MSDFVHRKICEGVGFASLSDDRFKIGRLGVTLFTPLDKKTAAANALLFYTLAHSCKKYPDFTALSRRQDELYGASVSPSVRRGGNYQLLSLFGNGLSDRYALGGQKVSAELAELMCSMLFEPDMENGIFSEESVSQERRELLEEFDAEYNDKRSYSIMRCIDIMCEGEIYAAGRAGKREDVENVTQEQLYNAWKSLLANARVELSMLGSSEPDHAFESFSEHFAASPRKEIFCPVAQVTPKGIKRETEKDDVSQSKLVMGYRCHLPQNGDEYIANQLMSAVLGATPTSKLFLNVREKQSLCYYCVSQVDNDKGIMLIDSGVEGENIEKTEKAVSAQLEELKKGNITDEEMEAARLAMKNVYLSSLDSLGAMQAYYISGIIRPGIYTPERAAAAVDSITKEMVIEMASQVVLDTVFTLSGN